MPQLASGFTLFELQCSCQTLHILTTKSYWLDPASIPLNITDFMLNLQQNLITLLSATKDCFQTAHAKNCKKADSVKHRTFVGVFFSFVENPWA